MRENDLRKYHRRTGITVALFVFVQAFTGLLLSLDNIAPSLHLDRIADPIHFGGGLGGNIYRVFLALGLLFMASTGPWIFRKMWIRSHSIEKKPL
jgi:hypothetical protein